MRVKREVICADWESGFGHRLATPTACCRKWFTLDDSSSICIVRRRFGFGRTGTFFSTCWYFALTYCCSESSEICKGREAYIYRNPAPGGYQSEIVVADNAAIRMLAFPEIEVSFSELFLPV
jgi:hypothetical protein